MLVALERRLAQLRLDPVERLEAFEGGLRPLGQRRDVDQFLQRYELFMMYASENLSILHYPVRNIP